MSSVNKVIIIGNLGKDPELRTFPSGDAVCNVSIATTDKWKDKATGEMKEATEWHRVTFNGRQAEIASQYLRKGSSCYVEGSLRTRKWTDKDGAEKFSTEIRADRLQLLGSPSGNGGGQGGGDNRGQGDGSQRQQAQPQQRQQPQRDNDRNNDRSPGQRSNQQQQRSAAPANQGGYLGGGGSHGGGFDDMDSDIPFVSSCMSNDMTTSKQRRVGRYDY